VSAKQRNFTICCRLSKTFSDFIAEVFFVAQFRIGVNGFSYLKMEMAGKYPLIYFARMNPLNPSLILQFCKIIGKSLNDFLLFNKKKNRFHYFIHTESYKIFFRNLLENINFVASLKQL
jgi:hypothetical protein